MIQQYLGISPVLFTEADFGGCIASPECLVGLLRKTGMFPQISGSL